MYIVASLLSQHLPFGLGKRTVQWNVTLREELFCRICVDEPLDGRIFGGVSHWRTRDACWNLQMHWGICNNCFLFTISSII